MEKRIEYYDDIKYKLSLLAFRIELNGGLNLLNEHVHAEDFYLHLANLIFGWKLENLNAAGPNAAGIDLIDTQNKIVIQVSATATRQKIESALAKKRPHYEVDNYSFKFISISKDASHLRKPKKEYVNPHRLKFVPTDDIYDVIYLLGIIKGMHIEQMCDVYELCEREFKSVPEINKIETNLAAIIKALSKENWNNSGSNFETASYEIDEKIEENRLREARVMIDDHAVQQHRISKIYGEFDSQGANKSLSILNGIRRIYLEIITSENQLTPDQIFFEVVRRVIEKIRNSANYKRMPAEELDLCAEILVVDTFIRCKIFRNPTRNQNHAHP
ncbi:MAG: ABC-three component system protein [Candidatus Promineifilaceae bacterium]